MKSMSIVAALTLLACTESAAAPADDPPGSKSAVFAGGCFWCMESDFEHLVGDAGVITVVSGYAGGVEKSPSYEQVSSGGTRHNLLATAMFELHWSRN